MNAGEAAAKTAAPYVIGVGVIIAGGYALFKWLPDAGEAAKDALNSVKDAAVKVVTDERDSSSLVVENTIQDRFSEIKLLPSYDVGVQVTYKEDGTPDMKQFVDDVGGVGEVGYTIGTMLYPDSVIKTLTDAAIDSKIAAETSPAYKTMIEESYDLFGAVNPLMGIDTIDRALLGIVGIETTPLEAIGDTYDYAADKWDALKVWW